jgi:hypothetical protein
MSRLWSQETLRSLKEFVRESCNPSTVERINDIYDAGKIKGPQEYFRIYQSIMGNASNRHRTGKRVFGEREEEHWEAVALVA